MLGCVFYSLPAQRLLMKEIKSHTTESNMENWFQWQRLQHTGKETNSRCGHQEEAIPGDRCLAPDSGAHVVLEKRLPSVTFGEWAGGLVEW